MTNHVNSDSFPTLDGLRELLSPWLGQSAYLIPMTNEAGELLGNNGDRLMHAVFHAILDEFAIRIVHDSSDADLVIVPPNGALLEVYRFPQLLAQRLTGLGDKPLVLFPSSALFDSVDPSFMFAGRTAPTLWIFRESYSLRKIGDAWGPSLERAGVRLALDHDVVASGHRFVPAMFGSQERTPAGTLVGARIDREASDMSQPSTGAAVAPPAGRSALRSLVGSLARRVPYGRAKTSITRLVRRNHLTGSGERLRATLPEGISIAEPVRYLDSSADQYATYAEYLDSIANSETVITNRLHMALPAAILGKRVVIVEAGYHKLEGVYNQSLRDAANVTLITARRERE